MRRLRESSAGGGGSKLLSTDRRRTPSAPEERFADLFKAARALLKKGITEEDQIYPTLAFANELRGRD